MLRISMLAACTRVVHCGGAGLALGTPWRAAVRRPAPTSAQRAAVMATAASPPADEWAARDNRRFLHAVARVGDAERAIAFYSALGMKVLRRRSVPEEKVLALCSRSRVAPSRRLLTASELLFPRSPYAVL